MSRGKIDSRYIMDLTFMSLSIYLGICHLSAINTACGDELWKRAKFTSSVDLPKQVITAVIYTKVIH